MHFRIKLMNQAWENDEKTNFGSDFAHLAQIWASKRFLWILPLLDVRHCSKLSLYAISRKTYDPNSYKWGKTSFWAWFRPIGPKFKPPIFFSKVWPCQSLNTKFRYQHVKYQIKLMIQSWENLVTDEQTERVIS